MKPSTDVALVDDHVLLRNGLSQLVASDDQYHVLFEADHGEDFIHKLADHGVPQIVLMDINMPRMDGYETTLWLKQNHPDVKVLALSMYDSESAVIRMFKAGARGYILKDCEPRELKEALNSIKTKGFYYSEMVTGKFIHSIDKMESDSSSVHLNQRETQFLKHACTEKTYKEIADEMFCSPRTIDGYRDDLFEKLHVKTRVGLVIYAIKNGIVNV